MAHAPRTRKRKTTAGAASQQVAAKLTSPSRLEAPALSAPAGARAGTRAKRSAERRDAILAAALDEFSTSGFASTRLDDVARRAGVAKGTIYLHFADKETLFQELVRSMVSPVLGTLEQMPKVDISARLLIETLLNTFVREVYGTQRRDTIRLILSEGPRFPAIAGGHLVVR